MDKLRSYILVGVLASVLVIPASAWHVHEHDDHSQHDDGGRQENPDESCSICYAVKVASTAVDTSASVWIVADVSWTQTNESEVTTKHFSLPTANPRAPPSNS